MPTSADPSPVPSPYDPLVSLSLERLVERFAVARDHAEADTARELWGAIALKLDSRLQVYVRTFTIPNTSRRLHEDDRDEAFQRARRRVWFQLGRTFRGVSAGEVCNAAKRATWFACADVARERMKREQHVHRGRRASATQDSAADIDVLCTGQATMTFERAADQADLTDSLNRAMARMKNPSHRAVLQLELLGVPDTEIAERLGISRDNVHQRRHRGLVNLRELLADAHA